MRLRGLNWRTGVRRPLVGVFVSLSIFAGCDDVSVTRPGPSPPTALYVMNGLGETLSRLDLATGFLENNVFPLGSMPNAVRFDPDQDRLFAVNSGDNTVWSLQPDSLEKNGEYVLGPNSNPYDIVVTGSRELAVSNFVSGDVAFFDVRTAALLRRVAVGRTPEGLLSLSGRTLVTVIHLDVPSSSYGTGEVVSISDGASQSGTRVAVGLNPQDLVVGPDGLVHVVCTGNYQDVSGRIFFLNAGTLAAVDSMDIGGSPANAIVVGDAVYVSAFYGGLMKYDGRSHDILRGSDQPILDRTGLGGMAFDEARGMLYVSGFEEDVVYVVDTAADTLALEIPVGDGPHELVLVTR